MSHRPDIPGACSNNHELAPGENFCGLYGAPRADEVDPSGKNETESSGEPEPTSQGGIDPSRNGRGIWMLGAVLIVALAAVAITALVVHSGSHNASPKKSNIPPTTQPATSTSVPSTATPPTTSTPATSPPTGTGGVPMFVDCVYFSTPPQPTTYPTQMTTNCGGSSSTPLKNLSWSTWTATYAAGTGVYVVNSCEPSCSSGNYNQYPASVVLSDPGSTTWGRLFIDAQITYVDQSGQSQSKTLTYPQLVTH